MCEELETDAEKYFQVGVQLPPLKKEELLVFLRKNVNVFAWSAYEAFRVDPDFICHHMNVNQQLSLRSNHLGAPQKSMPRLLRRK